MRYDRIGDSKLAMFCYDLHPVQPDEDWPPLISSRLGFFLDFGLSREFFLATVLLHLHCSAVWSFRLGFCTAFWDISWCTNGYINWFDLIQLEFGPTPGLCSPLVSDSDPWLETTWLPFLSQLNTTNIYIIFFKNLHQCRQNTVQPQVADGKSSRSSTRRSNVIEPFPVLYTHTSTTLHSFPVIQREENKRTHCEWGSDASTWEGKTPRFENIYF